VDNYDERHYCAPRLDRTPGTLYPKDTRPGLPLRSWLALGVVAALLLTALWATGCGGEVWCSR
jgi:hypothetical protein